MGQNTLNIPYNEHKLTLKLPFYFILQDLHLIQAPLRLANQNNHQIHYTIDCGQLNTNRDKFSWHEMMTKINFLYCLSFGF